MSSYDILTIPVPSVPMFPLEEEKIKTQEIELKGHIPNNTELDWQQSLSLKGYPLFGWTIFQWLSSFFSDSPV
jgi:hypothetical protein